MRRPLNRLSMCLRVKWKWNSLRIIKKEDAHCPRTLEYYEINKIMTLVIDRAHMNIFYVCVCGQTWRMQITMANRSCARCVVVFVRCELLLMICRARRMTLPEHMRNKYILILHYSIIYVKLSFLSYPPRSGADACEIRDKALTSIVRARLRRRNKIYFFNTRTHFFCISNMCAGHQPQHYAIYHNSFTHCALADNNFTAQRRAKKSFWPHQTMQSIYFCVSAGVAGVFKQ